MAKVKHTVYLTPELSRDIKQMAGKVERSPSYLIERAWWMFRRQVLHEQPELESLPVLTKQDPDG